MRFVFAEYLLKVSIVCVRGYVSPDAPEVTLPLMTLRCVLDAVFPDVLATLLVGLCACFLQRALPERQLSKAAYLSHHAIVVVIIILGIDAI